MIESIDTLRTERHRLRRHLELLEQDPTHPLDFAVEHAHTTPVLVLREGQALRSAHSDVRLDYALMRRIILTALREKIAGLDQRLEGSDAGDPPMERAQIGDQTEA